VDPRPAANEIADFYDVEDYYTHAEAGARRGERAGRWVDRLRLKLAWLCDRGVELDEGWFRARLKPGARICDVGCGSGGLLGRLARLGYEVTGVEPDPQACAVAQRQVPQVFAGTAEEIPPEVQSRRFDCVVMAHVLEHTREPRRALGQAADLLAEGGLLVVETPNNDAEGLRRSGLLWPWLDVPRHLNFFTERSLRELSEGLGLKVLECQFRGYTRQFNARWIHREASIREIYDRKTDGLSNGRPVLGSPHRGANAWQLLATTAWASARRKYDSVRIVAVRSG
jgi:SAM-dependent methyltransferase